ncbi:MAG TPA: HlyD family secretion protein [Bryobacteraceae bacterium]|nr:HlyD family secretion protein [Bryobacteraceae bacterium]
MADEKTQKTPPPPPPPKTEPAPEPERARRSHKALIAALVVGAILAVGGFLFWRYSETYESTDDAEVDAHLVGASTRIQGTVVAVNAEEDQSVKAGQLLVVIDPRDYQVAVEQNKADLAQAEAATQAENPNVPITQVSSQTNISTTQSDVVDATAAIAAAEGDLAAAEGNLASAQARLREAEANNVKAQADVTRYKALVDKDEVAREQYDTVVAAAKAQAATVDSARAAIDSASASADAARKTVEQRRAQLAHAESQLNQANRNAPRQVAISRATLKSRQASADAARARVDQALLNLSYTKIYSPVDGVVSKRSVEIGATVQPGQQLFSIAQISDLWVTANFKETQLRHMHPGQRVSISVDAFDQKFGGYVENMPGATGAITSLLPPENATGNYVKVVQRLPVRIRFDKDQQGLDRLRPGMSVEPKVWLQ